MRGSFKRGRLLVERKKLEALLSLPEECHLVSVNILGDPKGKYVEIIVQGFELPTSAEQTSGL